MADDENTFSSRLMRLIETVHPADRGPYSYREIARALTDQGVKMSTTTVHQLATGQRKEPKMRDVQGLAAFFGVPVDYFLDEQTAARVDEQIANIKLAADEQATDLALRTVSLSDSDRAAVANLIAALEEHEQQSARPRRRRDNRNR